MACNYPIPAMKKESGEITLHPPLGNANLEIPCGTCMGCRANKANEWAQRAQHEAKMHKNNIFATLTYNNENTPPDGALYIPDLQRFWKRLRKKTNTKLRYLACGEYGDTTGRPHYHALIFGLKFEDQKKAGKKIEISETLNKIWQKGECRIGEITQASARYVAKYQIKQRNKTYINEDGIILQKPFLHMSRKPPIGTEWLKKYEPDIANGYIINEGNKHKIPRAYMKYLEKNNPETAEEIKYKIEQHNITHQGDKNTKERREAREEIMIKTTKTRKI